MLQPNKTNRIFHAITRAKAKMYEYNVPADQHIKVGDVPLVDMLDLTIGMLGELSADSSVADISDEKYKLLFSAQYFNSLLEADAIISSHSLLRLLSASAYYLSSYPGSCQVVLKSILPAEIADLDIFERILLAVLERKNIQTEAHPVFQEEVSALVLEWEQFLAGASSKEKLNTVTEVLKLKVYATGTDKELLFVDIIRTIILKRFTVSAREILSEYSDAEISLWENYLIRDDSLKEFWPSQVKLAEHGVFKGVSAIVQMPTSAGKTRAAELIIRNSFLSGRGTIAVLVAPFRALCQEIYNDFIKNFSHDKQVTVSLVSDVLQEDFSFSEDITQSVLVLTPEKLDFLLRHDSGLASRIGLMIYDEGHLFDDEQRGAKYELLLSSLKNQLPATAQVILISAVISNAEEVRTWLMNESGTLVDGKDLSPTNRSIAFVQWNNSSKFLQFVDEHNIGDGLFFVPSVLRSYEIEKRGREHKKFFPKPKIDGSCESSQIAGFLSCRLASVGLSAVFVGLKSSTQKIAREIIDAYDRGFPIDAPINFSDNPEEANKMVLYVEKVLGSESISARAAKLGILIHHGGVPHGLRLATEYALQKGHFKVVLCTSSLAQGINLPIRYLIISTIHQAKEKIKTRDFHNLMGRAGRAGKYTEGTVIFADPDIYKSQSRGDSKWTDVSILLESNNSEPSLSRLNTLLEDKPTGNLEEELEWEKNNALVRKEITSYLLNALLNSDSIEEMEIEINTLVQNTLGYSQLETEGKKNQLTNIFLEIGREILIDVSNKNKRASFAKSILTLKQSEEFIESLGIEALAIVLLTSEDPFSNSLTIFWKYLYKYGTNKSLKLFTEEDALVLCHQWINSGSFLEILISALQMERSNNTSITLMDIIDLCENGFSYDLSTILGSLTELSTLVFDDDYWKLLNEDSLLMQKRLKYGLPDSLEFNIYELGFSDRNLSMEIATIIRPNLVFMSKFEIKDVIKKTPSIREKIRVEYPEYFVTRFDNLSI